MTLNWNFQRNGVFKPKSLPWGAQIFSGTAITYSAPEHRCMKKCEMSEKM